MCRITSFLTKYLWGGVNPLIEENSIEDDIIEESKPNLNEFENIEHNSEIIKEKNTYKDMVVLLDCGHAEKTCGKRKQRDDGSYYFEYISNREIGRIVANKLENLGIKYHFVENLDDPNDKGLTARANTANEYCAKYGKNNCIFISLHSNACGNGDEWKDSARGWSIYTTKGKTKSDEYATIFFEEAEKIFPQYDMTLRKDMSDGDPDYEENFTVIYKTLCPAVLVEAFFYTSHKDLAFLDSEIGKNACADVIVNGIKRIMS